MLKNQWAKTGLVERDRRIFDPRNQDDLVELKYFRIHGKWRDGCPFTLEWPYENVSLMCQDKLTTLFLENIDL